MAGVVVVVCLSATKLCLSISRAQTQHPIIGKRVCSVFSGFIAQWLARLLYTCLVAEGRRFEPCCSQLLLQWGSSSHT